MRWARHAACMGVIRNSYNILIGKQEGKGSFGRPRRRWEYNERSGKRVGRCGLDSYGSG
jgi:hypothetical protein